MRWFSLALLSACTSSDGDTAASPIKGLYDTSTPEDGSCRFLDEAGDIFACSEAGGFGCESVEGSTVRLEASPERCPDDATATCGEDPETRWSYYGSTDGEFLGAWCEACAEATVPADTCDGAVDADGDGVASETDCDDHDANVYPGGAETCDGVDQDCSGVADDGVVIDNGACVEGTLTCDSGYTATNDLCVAWRDPWIGDYTYTSACGGIPSVGGVGTFSADGSAPTDLLALIDGQFSFGISLQGPNEGAAPSSGATLVRDATSGTVEFTSGDCVAVLVPTE